MSRWFARHGCMTRPAPMSRTGYWASGSEGRPGQACHGPWARSFASRAHKECPAGSGHASGFPPFLQDAPSPIHLFWDVSPCVSRSSLSHGWPYVHVSRREARGRAGHNMLLIELSTMVARLPQHRSRPRLLGSPSTRSGLSGLGDTTRLIIALIRNAIFVCPSAPLGRDASCARRPTAPR